MGGNPQETQQEDAEKHNLGTQVGRHADDDRQRDQKDQEIGGDVEADESPHVHGFEMAFARYGWVPELGQRDAQRAGRDKADDVVDDDHGEQDVGCNPGVRVCQDADVQDEDRYLAAEETELVEQGGHPSCLSGNVRIHHES